MAAPPCYLLQDANSPPSFGDLFGDLFVRVLTSNFCLIFAALFWALICLLGLITVARCAWIRLNKKVLKSLPIMIYGEEIDNLSDCAICLLEFAAGEEIRVLPQCGHVFHLGCIDTWLGSHSSCPYCRQILVVSPCKKYCELPAVDTCGGAQP